VLRYLHPQRHKRLIIKPPVLEIGKVLFFEITLFQHHQDKFQPVGVVRVGTVYHPDAFSPFAIRIGVAHPCPPVPPIAVRSMDNSCDHRATVTERTVHGDLVGPVGGIGVVVRNREVLPVDTVPFYEVGPTGRHEAT